MDDSSVDHVRDTGNSVERSLLNSSAELGLIVLDPNGASHSAQTRGMLCNHREAKGQLVPLNQPLGLNVDAFHAAICCIDPEQLPESKLNELADIIDEVLSDSWHAFRVDREHLRELEEAWIPVVAGKNVKAILVYQNCD